MQFLIDLLPVIAFFVAYKVAGIYVATGVLIAGVLIQTAVSWIRHRKVSPMLLTSAVLVLVFGGLTLLIHDATFIMWKPSIVNWLFAGAFLVSQFMRGPTIIQRMLGENVTLEAADWRRLNMMWVGFFVVAGALEPVRRVQLRRSDLGEFQAVRPDGPDAGLRAAAGRVDRAQGRGRLRPGRELTCCT